MVELDLIWMSLCIFLPSAFALILLFFPKVTEEYMRWWSLLGTAVTLVVSLFLFIDYLRMLDHNTNTPEASLLASRVQELNLLADAAEPRNSDNMVSRYPWVPRFNIDYFIGVDGISM